ncbi:photosystem II stability/assembly factor-like uncharacterized protein [Saonia flava]|uniref:Photosystem II stability/assembly factor-like uncharacterized protein n=1 Tax=Saonia flava TaxID=523696 RepID=A0A846QWX7_9FLAO|nr:thrombospondin type 3 repeat-containing protein [Saonia flava]NJB72851.1 photosystem II stability/assembly factor-like uncharacterized protein [Saonia flava]
MIRKVLLVCFFISSFSYAQFNEGAPWMNDLEKNKSTASKSSKPSYSIYEISEAFHKYWLGKDSSKKGSGYKPYMRWENYWMNYVDQDGHLPSSEQLWNAWKSKSNNIAGKAVNPTSDWSIVGPESHGFFPGQLPGQGRVNAIAVDPNDENVWYVGAPAGGIWKSTDAGSTWISLFDNFLQIGVSGIAIDPNDSNIIYIATGDDDASDSYSIGVFKSIDGGASWNETGLNPSNTTVNTLMNEIVIDPSNSDILWVGTNGGLLKSIDGGDTWETKRNGNIKDFKLKPDNSSVIYAVSNSNFYRSVNGGDDFTEITDNLPSSSGRLVLGVSAANPEVVYILSADVSSNDFAYQGLYKSIDGGTTFVESPNTIDILESSQAWFDLALEVSPTNEDELYIGCLNIWKSTNGGNSFSQLNEWFLNTPSYTHADIHTLKIFNGKLYCGSDGGIYVSEDNGATFTDYTAGIAISQLYRISVSPQDSNKIIGGFQDNGGLLYNNGEWNSYHGGDGMDNVIDPGNNKLLYGFMQFGQNLFISLNSGQSVTSVSAPNDASQGNWITPLAIDSEGDVFAGYDAVYKLVGSGWEKWSNGFSNGNIEDLEIDPNNPMIMYAADDNFIFRSDNGGTSFSFLPQLDSEISDIAINNNDSNIIYVVTSNRVGTPLGQQTTQRGVFKVTVDGSNTTFEDITLNLPTDQAYFAIVHQGRHPDNPIYVATSLGVYRLDDTLTEWEDYFTGLPNTAYSDLEISLDDELITASTYGRGVWQSPIPVQLPDADIRLLSVTPTANSVFCGQVNSEILVENTGLNPVTEIDITYSINEGTDQVMNWTGTLNAEETTTIDLGVLNISEFGKIVLNVTASAPNDAFSDNNTLNTLFFNNDYGLGGTINTFETANETLIAYNEGDEDNSVWEKGIPSGAILNEAGSGTNVYATILDGNHPDATKGILMSNCYEMANILAPVLKFNMAYDLEENWDIVYVQYSIDEGNTWNVLGNINSQPNWYTSDRTNISSGDDDDCQNCPGAQWTGTNATITEYAYDFTANANNGEVDLTNEPNVLFRIVFHSDAFVTQEGVVIDDFVIEGFQDDDDDDNDGVLDVDDNCPLSSNANQLDTDGDGDGDACDTDDDDDGILDVEDICPLIANPNQEDFDGDGIGDICDDDIDNDGVPNNLDLCPDTPSNSVVDVNGCIVFSLPVTNFTVLAIGESCISSNNGSIQIDAVENLNYTATLSDGVSDVVNTFTTTTLFENLTAGAYTLCLTVDGQTGYESCRDIIIGQPDALSVSSKVSSLKSEVTLNLEGGKSYTINLNNEIYATSESEITLSLSKVENTLSVKTDQDCQGIYEETIILDSGVFIYPNPIESGNMTIYLGESSWNEVELSLYTVHGATIFSKAHSVIDNRIKFSVDALPHGVYLLNLKTDKTLTNYKIIRK